VFANHVAVARNTAQHCEARYNQRYRFQSVVMELVSVERAVRAEITPACRKWVCTQAAVTVERFARDLEDKRYGDDR